jgi:hypothetical protein
MMNRMMRIDPAQRERPARTTPARPIAVTTEDEREFQLAMERYKCESGRQFPTWSEVLEVLRSIAYAKRIWKPVAAWSPIDFPTVAGLGGGDDGVGTVGWFSQVEIPLGP